MSSDNHFSEIKLWMTNKGLLGLTDICSWYAEGNWVDWKFPKIPDRLILDQSNLIKALFGLAPIHFSLKDKWGSGASGVYSMGHGYSKINPSHASLLTSTLWKSIWSFYGFPKVNYLSWLLMHQKDLTEENSCNRG